MGGLLLLVGRTHCSNSCRELLPQVADIVEPSAATPVGQDLYFEVLELQPMQFTLSFMRTDRVGSDER
jgi:vacuolar protein sorting-associated protein 13A/C